MTMIGQEICHSSPDAKKDVLQTSFILDEEIACFKVMIKICVRDFIAKLLSA